MSFWLRGCGWGSFESSVIASIPMCTWQAGYTEQFLVQKIVLFYKAINIDLKVKYVTSKESAKYDILLYDSF